MMNPTWTLNKVQRTGLVEHVIHQIQTKISRGEFPRNRKIPPEPMLMKQLGVGRSTVREAIRAMASAGVLDVRQGDGTYVRAQLAPSESLDARLKRASLLELYQVRKIIEIEIAGLAAENRSEGDLSKIRRHLTRRQRARDREDNSAYLDADIAFHIAIAESTKNPVLTDLFVAFSNALRNGLEKLISDPLLHDDRISLHEPLFKAIKDRDAAAARHWTTVHVDTMLSRIRKALK